MTLNRQLKCASRKQLEQLCKNSAALVHRPMLGATKAGKSDEVKSNRVPYRTQRIPRQIRPIRRDDLGWSRTVVVFNPCIPRFEKECTG